MDSKGERNTSLVYEVNVEFLHIPISIFSYPVHFSNMPALLLSFILSKSSWLEIEWVLSVTICLVLTPVMFLQDIWFYPYSEGFITKYWCVMVSLVKTSIIMTHPGII
jgi:hypothetical protein